MPRIYYPVELNVHVRFFCSVSTETISSLHVLSNPEHHTNCLDWYESAKKTLHPRLLSRIRDFGHKYADWSFVMDLADLLAVDEVGDREIPNDFDAVIFKIKHMDLQDFAYVFLGETLTGSKEIIAQAIADPLHSEDLLPADVFKFINPQNVIDFLNNISAEKAELISIIEQYYYSYFENCWNSLREVYYGKIILEKKLFNSQKPIDYILSLHKGLVYDNGFIVIKKETDLSLCADRIREVRLFFSMFTYPHFAANVYEDTISVYKNLLMPMNFEEAEEISKNMKAFSDVNRLSIIKLLLRQSATNKELAQLLNVAPASISQHLNMLKEMDLLTSTKYKNNINYHISHKKINDKILGLCSFLETPIESNVLEDD